MEETNNNMTLWNKVQKTDPANTKPFQADGGYSGTAINGTSVIMEATRVWGPIGVNWGFNILDERIDNGAVVFDDDNNILGNTMTNTVKLELWVKKILLDPGWKSNELDQDPVAKVVHFGHTPFIRWNRTYKNWTTDQEATKKSMTDAMKKCLSMYGFNADIFLGLYDDVSYLGQLKDELEVEKSDDKLATHIKQQQEYDNWFLKHYQIIETAVTKNELELVFKTCYRKIQRKEDREGLLKMTRAKDKRLKELEKKANDSTVQTDGANEGTGKAGRSGSRNGDSGGRHNGSDQRGVSGQSQSDSDSVSKSGPGRRGAGQRDKTAAGTKKAVREPES